ncbi:MAG: hypothetical protein AAGE89_09280 [Pseudomonadota bacterium]
MTIFLIERDYGREGRAIDEADTSAPLNLETIVDHIALEDDIVSVHEWDRADGIIIDVTEDIARACLTKYEAIDAVPAWVRGLIGEPDLNPLYDDDDLAAIEADERIQFLNEDAVACASGAPHCAETPASALTVL